MCLDGQNRCVWLCCILVSNTLTHSTTWRNTVSLKHSKHHADRTFIFCLTHFPLLIHSSTSVRGDIWRKAYHDGEDQGHNVDGVRRTKAGEDSQAKIAAERRWRFLLLYGTAVEKYTSTHGALNLWIKHPESHRAWQMKHSQGGAKN